MVPDDGLLWFLWWCVNVVFEVGWKVVHGFQFVLCSFPNWVIHRCYNVDNVPKSSDLWGSYELIFIVSFVLIPFCVETCNFC